ncbi:hypothetical protein [Halobaculum rubrum]|uniref:hypothetical protein n=1 Tax=Halobaculum rubrum TaxID=2872158 RepID=UPI001CA3F08D|nr:hypothetical protein [Halobaculum rubrum]QZY00517.1 hypothetical protein K6T25_05385 [Halobaculum rubrum]
MSETTAEDVEDWWESSIDQIRENEGSLFHGLQDFNSPAQVEVFWIQEPIEGQAVMVTHDRNRSDKEITINGPYQGDRFIEEVATVGQEERWRQALPPQALKTPPGRQPIREDALAIVISKLVSRLEESIFNDFSSSQIRFLEGERIWGNSSYHVLVGNVVDFDLPGEFTSDDDQSESDEESKVEPESDDDSSSGHDNQDEEMESQPAGGGFIYPAVWVDRPPEREFEEKVWGSYFRENEVVYQDEILGKGFLAFRDGLLAVLDDDGDHILKLLNTFFGIGIYGDHFQWRSLQPREFISGQAGPGGFANSHAELSTPSGRNQLWHGESGPADHERSLISVELIEYLLRATEVVFEVEDLRERVTLHLQAHTHFIDDEYTASFLLNWNIIEQHIEELLNRTLRDEYEVNRDRRETIQGHNWFISHRIELAEITGVIDDDLYSELDRHRKKRNKVVHDMETVSAERAEDIDHFVSELLTREINTHLESTEVDPIVHKPVPMKPKTRRDWRKGDYDPKKWES